MSLSAPRFCGFNLRGAVVGLHLPRPKIVCDVAINMCFWADSEASKDWNPRVGFDNVELRPRSSSSWWAEKECGGASGSFIRADVNVGVEAIFDSFLGIERPVPIGCQERGKVRRLEEIIQNFHAEDPLFKVSSA